MKTFIKNLIFILLLVIACYGCATDGRYAVESERYATVQEALEAIKEVNNKEAALITPTKTSVGGKVHLIMLSESMMNGTLALANSKVGLCFPKNDKDFLTGRYKLMADFLEQIIKKRIIFNEVKCSISDDPEKDAKSSEVTSIYTVMTSKGAFRVYLKKKGKEPVLINADINAKTKLESNISFLDAIEKAAK